LRAAAFELGRRRGQLAGLSAAERHDLAVQAADDAMMGVLARLGDFRGLSRFSTWAYKFALLEAATKARRLAWRDREPPRPPQDWVALAERRGTTRGALYKTIHDARRKLRVHLTEAGLLAGEEVGRR
jgi:RNA polymerase sigma-70 factor (ECF subfamily)